MVAFSAGAQTRLDRSITVAGGGLPVNLPGISAQLGASEISGLAADSAGNLYISSAEYALVLRLDTGGNLSAVAGTGFAGFSGDGGPATAARLNAPGNLAVAPNGDLYIADTGNLRVRKVSGGVITTVAGSGQLGSLGGDGGPATAAGLESIEGVAVDGSGNLYFAEWANSCVRKVSGGVIATAVGTCGNPMIVDEPKGVAVDSAGTLYVSSAYGTLTVPAGGKATYINAQQWPQMAVDSAGDLFMATTSQIIEYSNGSNATLAGDGSLFGFSGDGGPAISAQLGYAEAIAVDSSGNIYVADTWNRRIRKISNGTISTVVGGGTSTSGLAIGFQLYTPGATVPDGKGGLYVADTGNNRILRVSNGAVSQIAGVGQRAYSGDGGPASAAGLNGPSALALDSSGNLYIADYSNQAVREISGGIMSTAISNITAAGIAVDSAGNLYLSTGNGCQVLKFAGGQKTVFAGNGTPYYTGDNGPAISAGLDIPTGLFMDRQDNLYIVEEYGGRIRKVSGGTITTVAGSSAYGPSEGSGPYPVAPFYYPTAVAVDAAGDVYVSTGGEVLKVSHGEITTVHKAVGSSVSMGLAIDSAGVLYVADLGNQRILALLSAASCTSADCPVPLMSNR
jgi:sugar lactone lactonase YvrE